MQTLPRVRNAQTRGGHHMKIIVTGKNIAISEKIQDAIDKKFEKLGKYFADDIQAKVIIHPEKSKVKMEATIVTKGTIFRAEDVSQDVFDCIDIVAEKLLKQFLGNDINTIKYILRYIFCSENCAFRNDGCFHLHFGFLRMDDHFSLNVVSKVLPQLFKLLVNGVLNFFADCNVLSCYDNLHMMTSSRLRVSHSRERLHP